MKKTITIFFAAIIVLQNVHAQNWRLTGNGGIVDTNFIGTKNAAALKFKVNNKLSGKIDFLSSSAGTSFGFQALKSNAAAGNTAFGYVAMIANTSGFANTAMGQYSMNLNVGGYSNTAFGSQSLAGNISGYFNTAIGQAALSGSKGFDNTAVGRYSLVSLTTGNSNTALGSATNVNDGTLSNVTLLGDFATGTASNQVRVGNGSTTSIGGQVDWSTLSDARVKRNIKQNVPGLDFINKLQPVTYNLNLDALEGIIKATVLKDEEGKILLPSAQDIAAHKAKEKIVYSGFIAQDVEKIAKSLNYDFSGVDAAKNSKDLYGLRYAEFVVPLVKAVQELSKQNESLQQQIDELKRNSLSNSQSAFANTNNALSKAIHVSPNPVRNQLTVSGLSAGVSNYIELTDLNGRSLLKQKVSDTNETFDVSRYANGTYELLYFDGTKMQQVKFIKQ
ncbi:MAG: tail fiber domain-containing protein [Parafilimonas sp.]